MEKHKKKTHITVEALDFGLQHIKELNETLNDKNHPSTSN